VITQLGDDGAAEAKDGDEDEEEEEEEMMGMDAPADSLAGAVAAGVGGSVDDKKQSIATIFCGTVEALGQLTAQHRLALVELHNVRNDSSWTSKKSERKVLLETIHQSTSLTTVSLRRNQIDDAGATALAAAIQHSTSMTTVDLFDNDIGAAGAAALAAAIQHSTSLITLNLFNNLIGAAGTAALAAAIKHSTSITTVPVGYYNRGVPGDAAVCDALKQCRARAGAACAEVV